MTSSILSDFLSGNVTATQWAGLCLVGGSLFAWALWKLIEVNLNDQREESRGRK